MTDIHAVIAELKELEAKEEQTLADMVDICNALPQLIAYIEKLDAVARSSDIILRTHSGYECARDALDALERDE